MADDKKTKLSIVIRAVDEATAKIKAINDRLDKVTKPARDFKKSLSDLREKSGLDEVAGAFKGVGAAIGDLISKVAVVGAVAGAAVAGLLSLIDGFDELGDVAERVGVSVDFLAQMRYAAERSGVEVQALDMGMKGFSQRLGEARAGVGDMVGFLKKASPALLSQFKAAKSNEEAFDLLAQAMAKIEDPAKRAALAQHALGDAKLAPLFARGAEGIKQLRDRYLELAGSQEGAVSAAGATDDALKDLHAATDGVKAALVEGLSPALSEIIKQIREWLTGHRADIKEWAASLGKKLPAAVEKLKSVFSSIIDAIRPFVDSTTKLKVIALVLAGIIVGPLVASIYTLGVALLTTPVGWIVAGIAAIAAGAYLLIDNWDAVSGFFVGLWDTVKAKFGWFADVLAILLAPVIAIPLEIIGHWDGITDFFASLWDGVTSIFKKAWSLIEPIVDKVIWGIDKVKAAGDFLFGGPSAIDLAKSAIGRATGPSVGDLTAQTANNLAAARANAGTAKVTVDFANAPRGTRATVGPQSTADIDLNVGYNLLPGEL